MLCNETAKIHWAIEYLGMVFKMPKLVLIIFDDSNTGFLIVLILFII